MKTNMKLALYCVTVDEFVLKYLNKYLAFGTIIAYLKKLNYCEFTCHSLHGQVIWRIYKI